MKKKMLFFLFMILAAFVYAQTPATPQPGAPAADMKPLAESLSWLEGQWQGEGVMGGDQEFLGTMNAHRELDDQALILLRESMNKSGGVSGGIKEIMVIGYEGSTQKIIMTLNTSKNSIGIYSGELKDHEIVFTLATNQPGYVDRRSFKQLADGGVSFVIERASPGKGLSKQVEIHFKKKS